MTTTYLREVEERRSFWQSLSPEERQRLCREKAVEARGYWETRKDFEFQEDEEKIEIGTNNLRPMKRVAVLVEKKLRVSSISLPPLERVQKLLKAKRASNQFRRHSRFFKVLIFIAESPRTNRDIADHLGNPTEKGQAYATSITWRLKREGFIRVFGKTNRKECLYELSPS
jgi:hypothetical protein